MESGSKQRKIVYHPYQQAIKKNADAQVRRHFLFREGIFLILQLL